jgi:hypothetical protein
MNFENDIRCVIGVLGVMVENRPQAASIKSILGNIAHSFKPS